MNGKRVRATQILMAQEMNMRTDADVTEAVSRFVTLALPVVLLSLQPGFRIEDVWYVSVASVVLQAMFSLLLIWREFRRRMPSPESTAEPAVA